MSYKIPSKQLLPYINNKDLFSKVEEVINLTKVAVDMCDKNLYKNAIDPFSAIFDALMQGISLTQWIKQERSRQIQKTMQNAVGEFHQKILGCVKGWKDMGTGNVFDLLNSDKKIIAEVKNKFNTTKGNHKVAIYDDLESQLKNKYKGYTAYYVEIIPQNRKEYNDPFMPSDNKTKTRRAKNEKIRRIDGNSFYFYATREKNALRMLYNTLPMVIGAILDKNHKYLTEDKFFEELFGKAYKNQ